MELIPIPIHARGASPRCASRAQRIGAVKFVVLTIPGSSGAPLRGQRAPGAVARFVFRVLGRLAAARP